MKKGRKLALVAVILLLLTGGGMLFNKIAHQKTPVTVATANITAVKVEQVKTSEVPVVLSYKATIDPVDKGIVSNEVAGKVVSILFDNNQPVAEGDPLIQLDNQDLKDQLNTNEANLQSLEINLASAQRNYDRNKQLFDHGAIAKSDFENVETALETAKANLNSANVEIANLKDSLAKTVITAPISGTINDKSVNMGQYVQTGTELAQIENISSVYAVIQVNQTDAKYIKAGQQAQVKLGESNSTTYEGAVNSIDVSADPSARVFNCKVLINNPDQALHPGVFAQVNIPIDQNQKTITIPLNALTGSAGEYSVFVLQKGVARKHSISIGRIVKDSAEVISGLQVGEQLILTNLNTLQDGDKVAVNGQGA